MMRGRAYSNIAFEREAYAHMHETDYLHRRKAFAWCEFFEIAVKASKKFLTAADEGEQSVNLCNHTFS